MSFLEIKKLEFCYGKAQYDSWKLCVDKYVLDKGTISLVRGNNMSGKSTFINLFSGFYGDENVVSSIYINGKNILSVSSLKNISTLISNADDMFVDFSIWDNIRLAVRESSPLTSELQQEKCVTFLKKSDIFEGTSIDMPLGNLSTGGKALVKLCRALVSSSELIVIDELTSYLDDSRAYYFLDEVLSFAQRGSAVVLVSHSERDRNYLANQANLHSIPIQMVTINRIGNKSDLYYEDK